MTTPLESAIPCGRTSVSGLEESQPDFLLHEGLSICAGMEGLMVPPPSLYDQSSRGCVFHEGIACLTNRTRTLYCLHALFLFPFRPLLSFLLFELGRGGGAVG